MSDKNPRSNNVLVFIVGGLVVAVAVIGWFVYNGGISPDGTSGGTNTDIKIEVPAAPEAPVQTDAPST